MSLLHLHPRLVTPEPPLICPPLVVRIEGRRHLPVEDFPHEALQAAPLAELIEEILLLYPYPLSLLTCLLKRMSHLVVI